MMRESFVSNELEEAAQFRATPAELARALAEVEAEDDAESTSSDGRISLEDAIRDLNLQVSAEALRDAVELVRARELAVEMELRVRRRRRVRRLSMGLILALFVFAVPVLYARGIDARDRAGQQLIRAVAMDDLDSVALQLQEGADPNARTTTGLETQLWRRVFDPLAGRLPALIVAANHGHPGIVAALLKAGADANIRDNLGSTPLHWLANHRTWSDRETDTLRLLLAHGGDPHLKNERGHSPVGLAHRLPGSGFERALNLIRSEQ